MMPGVPCLLCHPGQDKDSVVSHHGLQGGMHPLPRMATEADEQWRAFTKVFKALSASEQWIVSDQRIPGTAMGGGYGKHVQ